MNTKKSKNKNRPKPPKSPQNVPDTTKVEALDNVEVNLEVENVVKCENLDKEEAKAPKLTFASEQVPKIEEQLASDIPKKPKRSKAKKKQETIAEPVESDSKPTVSIVTEDKKDENVEKDTNETAVIPVARKKKNKSKKNSEQRKIDSEQIEVKPQDLESKIETNEDNTMTPSLKQIDVAEVETLKVSEDIQKESTIPKKKKKKKHRHDSDKSDIIDPCTLAFQKLLEPSGNKSEITNEKDLPLDSTTRAESTATPVPELILDSNESEDLKEKVRNETPKSKKKNKKNKKISSETDINFNIENKPEHEDTDITVEENINLETINVEQSLKSKAKIIKPVQKKRKTKSESQEVSLSISAENISESKVDENVGGIINQSEKSTNSEKEEKQKDVNIVTVESSNDVEMSTNSNLPEIKNETLHLTSNKTIEEFSLLETKSKNEPQDVIPEKVIEFSENKGTQQKKDKNVTETGKEPDNLGFVEVKAGKNKKKRSHKVDSVPENVELTGAIETKNIEKVEPIKSEPKNNDVKQGELKQEEFEKSEPIKDEFKKSEAKTNELEKNEPKKDEPTKEVKQDKESKEPLSDIQQTDFDVSSIKSEECEALCIATPDLIQYPRSTSQQHLDDNNNTLIKEITTPDEIKLGIPIFTATPIIQGSGESPEEKPLNEPVPIIVTKVDSDPSTSNNDKNDIKSRIFEVNKDMEELRRSIERSLAELTGSEKCDSEVDKEFEELFQKQVKENETAKAEDKLKSFEKPEITPTQPNKNVKEDKKEKVDIINVEDENISVIDKDKDTKPETTQSICVKDNSKSPEQKVDETNPVPTCPARNKAKGKSKKKGKKEPCSSSVSSSTTQQSDTTKDSSKPSQSNTEKTEQKQQPSNEKGKQQSTAPSEVSEADSEQLKLDLSFEPIENFEDALTSSVDDVNKTFEIIANEATESLRQNNPQINIIAPTEDTEESERDKKQKENPASQPKNLLGKPNIPVSSNKNDFKKEKNKPPTTIRAKVKIKDSVEIEKPLNKDSKEAQTTKKLIKETNGIDTYSYLSDTNEDFVYKYSFRKVFLQSSCHICKRELTQRFPCKFCSLVFYCSQKHLDEDWAKHQFLCFAVSTIAHLKDQKHIYADIQDITGHDYRVLRMQMILSCEKILKRKLVPWEQEALLYPRLCADPSCRQWKQRMLKDCEGCGQISYCIEYPEHLSVCHQRWCKSYALYRKLVNYQQTKGKLEPRLPTKVFDRYKIPEKMNEVLGRMYEEKIDMDDIQYSALTQLASAPLTAAYSYQLYSSKTNSSYTNGTTKKSTFTIHAVGTDLQFEADSLNKWEIFFLHLRPDVQELRIVLIGPDLNPSNLPLELLGKIKLCESCRTNKRRVIFYFQDKETYCDYYSSNDFITPDIVCAFNPNINRSCLYNIKDIWPATINSVLKQKVPFIITSYAIEELERDMSRVKEIAKYNFNIVSEPMHNPFSSMRPDRNFITDHEIPLLFKNYCFSVLCGVF